MKKLTVCKGLLAALLTTGVCHAESSDKNFAIGAVAGTTGIGAQVVLKLSDSFNLRGQYGQLDYDYDFDEDGIAYEGEFGAKVAGLMLDYYPFDGAFRLSAGITSNGNQLDAKAYGEDGTIEINGVDYPVGSEYLTATADWKSSAPYVGLGWGNPVGEGSALTVTFDMGVMFTGSPNVALGASEGLYGVADLLGYDLQSDLDEEAMALEEDLADIEYYPVVQLGLNYAF